MEAPPRVALCWLKGRLYPEAEQELTRQWPAWEAWPDAPGDPRSYARHLGELLGSGRTVVVQEGDVVPPRNAVLGLLGCAQAWCSHEVWTGERYDPLTLGLTKFSGELVLEVPGWPRRPLHKGPPWGELSHVQSVDVDLALHLVRSGREVHVHRPPAVHLRYANDPLLPARLPGYRPPPEPPAADVRPFR